MRRAHPGAAWTVLALLIASTAWAGHLAGIGEGRRSWIPLDVTQDQMAALKQIKANFLEEAKQDLATLRDARARFLSELKGVWGSLDGEQKARGKAIAWKVRSMPRRGTMLFGSWLLRSMERNGLRQDTAAWIEAESPEARVEAGDTIAWKVGRVLGGMAAKGLDLSEGQVGELKAAFEKHLKETREARLSLHGRLKEKLAAAWEVLTPEQQARLQNAKDRLLAWLRQGR